jgi:hypothetical protein
VTDDWHELDLLVEELRAVHGESWQRTEQLRQQMSGLQPHLEIIAQQYEELAVASHLTTLNERLLAGMGSVELIESGMGFEHVAALVWPSQLDPRDLGGRDKEGYFRIEVWMGPGLQDGRARVRLAGAKRLEATLPTNPERFRSALLAVFRDPQFVERPEPEEDATAVGASGEPAGEPPDAENADSAPEPSDPI